MLLQNTSTSFWVRNLSDKGMSEPRNYAIFVVKMSKVSARDKIIVLLRKHPEGLTIMEIAELLDISRITVAKYIYGLTVEGMVRQRQIGPAKLCYLEKKAMR
jgi:predicted ArsR family transcriptional regulator